jgi:hypothetical protein
MHVTAVCASLAVLLPLASAHAAAPGLPRIWGRSIEELDAKVPLYPRTVRQEPRPHNGPLQAIQKRQKPNTEDQCGPGFGSCADGYCCSDGGYGTINDLCG